MFVGIGITDADVAAFLSQATAQLPTALFWNSDRSLSASNRVDGYAPETAGPFAKLLAQNVGFSREAKAAEVMKTLDILWGRNTSGKACLRNHLVLLMTILQWILQLGKLQPGELQQEEFQWDQ
jgi:hypothetical protein